eukprot:gnl/TRDRNA2_/TRDRNA2_175038_c1_seq1.p2 gnl/TRDRNA2_/TRDRNA2_175038_c1~~gnl/TRDRNA2_/TRDRNA2_175038_c1_seq1.p2  ORF type:complete len:216 (+),score=45.35 gnl/TRDRNA2_/TRDRNA2_175038_c1_seq1:65-649(+)
MMEDDTRGLKPVDSDAKIPGPMGIAIDPITERLFVSIQRSSVLWVDVTNGDVGVVAGASTIAGYAGDGLPAKNSMVNSAFDLEMDVDNRILYICDTNNHVVRAVTLENNTMYTVGGPHQKHQTNYWLPASISLDKATNVLYVADSHNGAVRSADVNKVGLIVKRKYRRNPDLDETMDDMLPTKDALLKDQRWEF